MQSLQGIGSKENGRNISSRVLRTATILQDRMLLDIVALHETCVLTAKLVAVNTGELQRMSFRVYIKNFKLSSGCFFVLSCILRSPLKDILKWILRRMWTGFIWHKIGPIYGLP